mgnify:CR=1 FL=1
MSRHKVPKRAAKLVAFFEGFSPEPTDKLDGFSTVGYGHLIAHRPVTAVDRQAVWVKGQRTPGRLTKKESLRLLRRDLERFADAVAANVNVPINWRQASALISFTYNCGEGALASSTLLRRLNAGEYAAVPSELNRWVSGPDGPLPGLVIRRAKEGRLFRPLRRPSVWIWNR